MIFEQDLGPIGKPPESYWSPALGHYFHLRPADIGALTPEQLWAAYEFLRPE